MTSWTPKPRWFVMLDQGNGTPAPLVDEDERVCLFEDEDAADTAGFANSIGNAFGFDTYAWDRREEP